MERLPLKPRVRDSSQNAIHVDLESSTLRYAIWFRLAPLTLALRDHLHRQGQDHRRVRGRLVQGAGRWRPRQLRPARAGGPGSQPGRESPRNQLPRHGQYPVLHGRRTADWPVLLWCEAREQRFRRRHRDQARRADPGHLLRPGSRHGLRPEPG